MALPFLTKVLFNNGLMTAAEENIINKALEPSRSFEPMYDYTGGSPQEKQSTYEDYAECYTLSPWVYASLYSIMTSGASVPFRLYSKESTVKDEKKEITVGPLYALLQRPNKFMGWFDLMETTFGSLELTGNSYWELVSSGDPSVPIGSIYPLRSDRMQVIPDPRKYIAGYAYDTGLGESVYFQPEEIIHFKYYNPTDDYLGLSSLSSIQTTLETEFYALSYNKNFFKNGAKIFGVLETDRNLTDPVYDRLRNQWEQIHGGAGQSWKTAILEQGLKYHPISAKHDEMEFFEIMKGIREEIMSALGVPPVMCGVLEYSNYSTAYEQYRAFWTDTMRPKLRKIQDGINSFLIARFAENVYGEFDLSNIESLKEGEQLQAEIDGMRTRDGIWLINEIRERDHKPPLPWGNEWMPSSHRSGVWGRTEQPKEEDSLERFPTDKPKDTEKAIDYLAKSLDEIEGRLRGLESHPKRRKLCLK